jgi:hypothetical protein
MRTLSIILAASVALGAMSPAMAASADYYLIIDGVDGESTVAAKISSWSLGASNPTTSSSGASGRSENPLYVPPVSGGTNPLAVEHTVKSPRDASSGLATGRKSGELQAADFNRDGRVDFAEASQVDQVGPLTVSLPRDAATAVCARQGNTGKPNNGHLISSDGTIYDLSQMSIVCSSGAAGITGGAVAGIVIAASMKHTKTGHVTLMK